VVNSSNAASLFMMSVVGAYIRQHKEELSFVALVQSHPLAHRAGGRAQTDQMQLQGKESVMQISQKRLSFIVWHSLKVSFSIRAVVDGSVFALWRIGRVAYRGCSNTGNYSSL